MATSQVGVIGRIERGFADGQSEGNEAMKKGNKYQVLIEELEGEKRWGRYQLIAKDTKEAVPIAVNAACLREHSFGTCRVRVFADWFGIGTMGPILHEVTVVCSSKADKMRELNIAPMEELFPPSLFGEPESA